MEIAPAMKRTLRLSQVYKLLEPGPVVMVTTMRGRRPNIMTMSWLTMMEFEPPLVGCVMSNGDYSFESLKTSKECVINIPTVELASQMVGCGNTSGRNVDKFKKFGLTPSASTCVRAPLISECYANLECRLIDASMAAKYNFFILEVVKAHIDAARKSPKTLHHCGRGLFTVDGRQIKLPSRMK